MDSGIVRILIADDVAMIRDILRSMVTKEGLFTIFETDNGKEALRIYEANTPSIVFLDVNMPGSDGMTVLEAIRANDDSTFVVILSGENSAENVIAAVNSGANGYISKPFSQKNISTILKKYFDSKSTAA